MSEFDELYVMARRVLLDALDTLGHHRDAIVLVGAQASTSASATPIWPSPRTRPTAIS
jgi:hypothetical protein